MKRLFCSFLVFVMMLTMLPMTVSAYTQSPYYSDVNSSHDYFDAANYLYEKGIMTGVDVRKFGANITLTRAQIVTMLWRMDGSPEVGGNMPFVDCKNSKYYYDAVKWAVASGITAGIDPTHFGPDLEVKQQDTLLLLYRFIRDYRGYRDDANDHNTDTDFKELYKTFPLTGFSDYAKCAAAWAYKNRILRDCQVKAQNSCPRKNVANYLYRAIRKYMDDGSINTQKFFYETLSQLGSINDDDLVQNENTDYVPQLYLLIQSANTHTPEIEVINNKEYLVFENSPYKYYVNVKMFTEAGNNVVGQKPSDDVISARLNSLRPNYPNSQLYDRKTWQFYWGIRPIEVNLDNSHYYKYEVELALLSYHVDVNKDEAKINLTVENKCYFSFWTDSARSVRDCSYEDINQSDMKFRPRIDFVINPKNDSFQTFDYITRVNYHVQGESINGNQSTMLGVIKTAYKNISYIINFIKKPLSLGNFLNLLSTNSSNQNGSKYIYLEKTFESPTSENLDQWKTLPLVYGVLQESPLYLRQKGDYMSFEFITRYVIGQEFPKYVVNFTSNGKFVN